MWLHSSVGRASHRYRRGQGFKSRLSPDFFFRLLLSNCLNWKKIYCNDHSSRSSTTAVQIWIISCYSILHTQLSVTPCYATLLYLTTLYSTLLKSALLCSTLCCCMYCTLATLLYSTLHNATLLYSTLLYATLLYSTPRYCTLLYSTLRYYKLLYATLLYYTLHYSTLLYCALLYCTLYYTVLYTTVLYCSVLYCTLCYCALGRFHVMNITFKEQIFGNNTSFYILLLSNFCLKFVQIFITWYLTISIKETLISFSKAVNIFVWNSVTDITKKSTSNFTCWRYQCYSCESTCET